MRGWVLVASICLVIQTWWASPAAAHTDLVSVSPADGSRVGDWPSQVVLVFTEAVDPTLSTVSVAVDRGEGARITLTGGDSDAEIVGDLRSLEPAGHGSPQRVRVSYRVTSADGHPIAGSSTFTVEAGTSGPPSAASDEAVEPAGSTPAPPDPATSSSALAVWLIGGVLTLLLVSAVVAVRRMRAWPSDAPQRRR